MRNVHVLAIALALSAAGMMPVFLRGGILGSEPAPRPELATLPVSLTVVGLAATAIPAALLMERIGRRNAFVASAAFAAAVVSYAVMSFIMTATPISLHLHDPHSDTETGRVIQSNRLAMYGPSLFSRRLIGRIGVRAAWASGCR